MNIRRIIDIIGKKVFECPYCGFEIKVPPRNLSMEKLRHMQDVKRVADLRAKDAYKPGDGKGGIANLRAFICPNCTEPIFGTDEFSYRVGEELKE